MRYLLDTVALVRHFTGQGKIGRKAGDGKFDQMAGIEAVWD